MAQLLVRGLDENIVDMLKQQAHEHGCSAEEEHRKILEKALKGPKKISIEQYLLGMPNVGNDDDFARSVAKERDDGLSD